MKKVLILLFFPIVFMGQIQTDTIFKKEGATIVCSITAMDAEYITFDIGKLKGRYIHKENVSAVSISGKREAVVYDKDAHGMKYYSKTLKVNDTVSVSEELDFMKMCMRECHKEFSIGLITIGGGVVLNTIGVVLREDPKIAQTFYVLGSVAILAGIVLMIDSHKWIKRAGVGVYGRADRVGVYYRFK